MNLLVSCGKPSVGQLLVVLFPQFLVWSGKAAAASPKAAKTLPISSSLLQGHLLLMLVRQAQPSIKNM
jgi:hypothetical protein